MALRKRYSAEELIGLPSDTALTYKLEYEWGSICATAKAADDYLLMVSSLRPTSASIGEVFTRRRHQQLVGTFVVLAGIGEVPNMEREQRRYDTIPVRACSSGSADFITVSGVDKARNSHEQQTLAITTGEATTQRTYDLGVRQHTFAKDFARLHALAIGGEVLMALHPDIIEPLNATEILATTNLQQV